MTSIRYCDKHGYFRERKCPTCSDFGESIIESNKVRTASGFLSKLLRHSGQEHGLEFTTLGWTDIDSVSQIFNAELNLDKSAIEGLVETDSKGRYEVDNGKIRAVYGHSISSISIQTDNKVPSTLYHGTAPRFIDSIKSEGLTPQSRNEVHLSASHTDAVSVGRRHSKADCVSVICIDGDALAGKYKVNNPKGNVYTVSCVPSSCFITIEQVSR